MSATGLVIVSVAVALALAFGAYRARTDGRARAVAAGRRPALDAASLGTALGEEATLVQFSTSTCAPCVATRRLLAAVSAERPEVGHVDIDAETRLDLVERYGVTRTPTVLLLDRHGTVRHRLVGPTRRPDLLDALDRVTRPAAA